MGFQRSLFEAGAQGASPPADRANAAGAHVEDIIAATLRPLGIAVLQQQVVGRNIYGGDLRADLLLPDHRLVVEVKWQDRRGSTDEKFPYLAANILGGCYRYPVIVVVDGGGAREGAVRWLQTQVDGNRFRALFGLGGFISFATRALER